MDLLSANVLLGMHNRPLSSSYHEAPLVGLHLQYIMYLHSCSEGREEERVQVDLLWEEDSPTSCHSRTARTHRVSIYTAGVVNDIVRLFVCVCV